MTDSLRDQLLSLGFKPPAPTKPARDESRGPHGKRPDGRGATGATRTAQGAPRPRTNETGGPRPEARNHRGAGRPGERNDRNAPPAGHSATPNARPAQARAAAKPRPGAAPGRSRTQADIDLAKAYAIRAQKEKEERIAAEAAKQEEARQRREARARLAAFIADKGLNVADADIARHFPYGGKIKRIYVNADQLKSLNAGELGVVQQDGRYILVTAAVLTEAESIFAPCVALRVDPDAPAGDDPYSDPLYQVPDDLVW